MKSTNMDIKYRHYLKSNLGQENIKFFDNEK
jgi:hypothetical protein